jgi:hypothetical protein
MTEQNEKREQILTAIAAELPPVVFRNWHKWRDVLPMAPRTVANDDSIGKGPKEKVFIGRNAGYPKQAFLEYLKKRIHFAEGKSN